VIELNRSRNNVVLSRRAVLEEERKEVASRSSAASSPGQVVEGKISNIVDFGAFVDLDGIDGLIHISELSWSHVNHPSEVVAIGDTVRIKVLDIDRDRQRISLGPQADPGGPVAAGDQHPPPGDVLEGQVTKVVAFGAFVEILPGRRGSGSHLRARRPPRREPQRGGRARHELNVKILEIDEERRRLSLSIKRVEGQNMPMGDLGEQIEASAEGSDEDSAEDPQAAGPVVEEPEEPQAAGPVADDDPPAHPPEGSPSTPPAAEESEEAPPEPAAEAEEPEAEAASEQPEAEGSEAEESDAEEPVAEAEASEAEESDAPES
jgi:small subunit ribosomal protein S1